MIDVTMVHSGAADTWRPPGAPPATPAAADDLYSGGSSGDEDDQWQSDPAAASMLNQLAGSIRQRGRPGEAEHTVHLLSICPLGVLLAVTALPFSQVG